jgi:histone-lysine N-methyltransferase SETMAR
MHDRLKFQEVCTWWVATEFKDQGKLNQMGLFLKHLLWYADEEDMLNRTVTRDESWVHHYQPESKCASMQRKHPSSPSRSTKKFKVAPSAGKVMLTVFWDSQGVLFTYFQKHGENVNSASYCEALLKLQDAIRRKRPGKLAREVLLRHDNARPHTARATQGRFQELQWEILEHPPYSPDLAPSDYHLIGALKRHLGSKRFTYDEGAEMEVWK